MRLSPLNIKKQDFGKTVRGFDKDEVNAFLEKIADEFETLVKENDNLRRELEAANSRLSEFRKIEKNLQDTLLKAQESSVKATDSAKRQTGLMIKEAEIKASQIIEKARESANEVRNAVINLREEKDLIIAKLKSIVSSQAHLLDIKVETAGDETTPVTRSETFKNIDINIDDIVKKIL